MAPNSRAASDRQRPDRSNTTSSWLNTGGLLGRTLGKGDSLNTKHNVSKETGQLQVGEKLALRWVGTRQSVVAHSQKSLSGMKASVAMSTSVKGCRTPARAGTPSLHASPLRVGVVQASGEETAGSTNLCGLMRGYGDLNGRGVAGDADRAN